MEKKIITIGEDLCNYIESLHYETYAMQDLLTKMRSESNDEINEFWLNKYIEKYTEYNIAKQQLETEYIIPVFHDNVKWNLHFETREVEVEVSE